MQEKKPREAKSGHTTAEASKKRLQAWCNKSKELEDTQWRSLTMAVFITAFDRRLLHVLHFSNPDKN